MSRATKNNCRPEGSICEPLAYLPKLVGIYDSSDMSELSDICEAVLNGDKLNGENTIKKTG